MKLSQTFAVAIVAVLALGIPGAGALASTVTGSKSFQFGNSQAGANGTYTVSVANSATSASASLNAYGNVMLLKRTARAMEFNAATQYSKTSRTPLMATYSLSLAGYTVDTGTKYATYTWNKSVNRTLLTANATVWAGPIPVTLTGSVGGGASIGYTLNLNPSNVGLNGGISGWATGSASGGVGVPGFNLSLQADLTLLKTSLNAGLQVTPTRYSGSASLCLDPLRADFAVVLNALGKPVYRYDLAHYTQPSQCWTLLRL